MLILLLCAFRFIHGGAWCDSRQDSKELEPALNQFLTRSASRRSLKHIAGFASINYGLSSGSHNDSSLNAKHPQHIQDVIKALDWLRRDYNVGAKATDDSSENGWNWIAVGHSCGATLAMQLCMSYSRPWGSIEEGAWSGKPPIAVVGLEGIYDLPHLNQTHSDQPFYAQFLTEAFGSDEKIWKEASPVNGQFQPAFTNGGMKWVVIAHSDEDELVEWEQASMIRESLHRQGWRIPTVEGDEGESDESSQGKLLTILKLHGTHDQIWSEANGLRTAIETALQNIFRFE
jgi:kynurenine formamidase